ncbi:hypothetical protein Pfo_026867 [Paulownia fortunei]|nr:hypothetical protein Pfo_026867 [Paulownia fortunei]
MEKKNSSYDLPNIFIDIDNMDNTHFRFKTQIVLITSVSGVAFAIISKGKIIHSRFKIPIDAIESNQCTLSKQSRVVELLFIKNIDKLLKNVMKNDENFGGKVVVFCEDFQQVLTVVPKATIYQTILVIGKCEELSDTKGNIKISEDMIVEYDNEENLILRFIMAIFPTLNKNAHLTHYMTSQASKNKNI